MSDESEPKANRTWLYVLGIVAGLPLLYALSIGPACVLVVRGVIPMDPVKAFYQPLEQFARCTGTSAAFGAYGEAWLNLTGTKP
jgi:hypothetical protein